MFIYIWIWEDVRACLFNFPKENLLCSHSVWHARTHTHTRNPSPNVFNVWKKLINTELNCLTQLLSSPVVPDLTPGVLWGHATAARLWCVATSVTDSKFVTQSKRLLCFIFSEKLILPLWCVSQVIFCIFIKILMLLLSKLKADQLKFTDYRYRYCHIYL